MRIALITLSFFPKVGGAEFVVHNLASAWSAQGHDVRVLAPVGAVAQPDAPYSLGLYAVPPSYLKFPPHYLPFQLYSGKSIQKSLGAFNPDFISVHMGYPLAVWLSRLNPKPKFLITCHGREITTFPWGYRKMYNIDATLSAALNASAGVVAISSKARELMEEMGVRKERILDIPNGVDLQRFRKEGSFDLRARVGISGAEQVILSVGREHPQKAYEDGIRAFARLAEKRSGVTYLLLGRGTSKWAPLVAELGLQERVVLHEGLSGDELVGAYRQANLFFSPSVWELMPLVVLEALACGLPMVVTNVSGSRDLVTHDLNGLLVEPGRQEDMVSGLERLLEDDLLQARMKRANLKKAEAYSWDRISRRYLEYS